jgi:hypothetical protein
MWIVVVAGGRTIVVSILYKHNILPFDILSGRLSHTGVFPNYVSKAYIWYIKVSKSFHSETSEFLTSKYRYVDIIRQ